MTLSDTVAERMLQAKAEILLPWDHLFIFHHMPWTIPEPGMSNFGWGKEGAHEAEPEPGWAINFCHKALLTSIPAADSFFKGYYFCCVAQQDLEFLKQVLMCERKGFISLSTGAAAGSSAAGQGLRSSPQKGQARGRVVKIDFQKWWVSSSPLETSGWEKSWWSRYGSLCLLY